MSYFIKHLSNYKTILWICLILVSVQLTHAQLVTGPSPVNPNSTHTYYHDMGTIYSPKLTWTVTGGTALSGGITGTNYHVNVQWGAAGTGTIVCKSGLILLGGKTVTIGTGPLAPPAPEISKFPGYTRLIRTTPPAGEIWYWQSSASGISTADPSYYIDRPYGTTSYYLRAYVSSSNTWSPATLVTYTVDPYAPSMDTNLSDENYVHTVVPRKRTTNLSNISNAHKMETVTYFDGLGRAIQSIGIRAGGDNEDIITHIDYDDYGRQDKEYLPYALSTNYGGYKTNALSATNTFYDAKFGSSSYPYSEKNLEDSPISRVTQQGAPGSDWRIGGGHEIEFDYQVNTGSEVRRFEVATSASVSSNITTYNPTLSLDTGSGNNNGNYEAGTLYKTVTKDENYDSSVSTVAHTTEEFKDQQGRVILKRTYGTSKIGTTTHNNVAHDTYYLYDEYGNLTYVLPPKMDASTATLSTINSQMNDLGYQYKYDDRNRLVEKRIPGKEWEYIVYNKLDRPIMTQDKNLRDDNDWLFTTYDDFGRVAYTGMVNKNWSRQAMQNHLNTGGYSQTVDKRTLSITLNGTTLYYENYFTNGAYIPTSSVDVFTINYYDDYTYDGFSSMPEISGGQVVINHDNAGGTRKLTKGLATGSKVRVLDSSPVEWITTTMGYDENGRTIYVKSVNDYLGTTDIVENVLDFTGAVDKTMTSHTKGSVNVITEDVMTYDHMGRLTKQTQELDNTDVLEVIVENTYDDLGQLESKDVGGQTTQSRLQTVDYTYNIRGWLKQINNPASLGTDLFAFRINYNTEDHNATKLYNGNISEVEWKTANTDSGLKWYKYSYDALNRITNATDDISRYSLSNLTYDKNGNIMTLNRAGHKVAQPVSTNSSHFATNMDILSYVYESNSNKLKSVNDTGYESYGFKEIANNTIEYDYDSNGNMTKDDNKGITSIEYNHLNLPTKVYLPSGNISYFYDATGVKLKKVVSTGGTTEYAGNYVYEGSSLKFFNHPEGYLEPKDENNLSLGYNYVYQYKDHLGNVRLSYKNDTAVTSVNIDDDFNSSTDGWSTPGSGSISNTNQKLNISITNRWNSTSKYLAISPNVPLHIEFDFEKGTMDNPYFIVRERINGVWESNSSRDYIPNLTDGHYTLDLTLTGDYIKIYFEKATASDNGTSTTCYVDNFKLTQNGLEILEENNYYPFGLKHKGYNTVVNGVDHPYGFGGKEEQNELGLNTLDFGARNYDATLGRWFNIDPLADIAHSISMTPYHYGANNPIVFVDPDGQDWFYYMAEGDDEAKYHWHEGSEYEHSYSYTDENGDEQTGSIALTGVSSFTAKDQNGDIFLFNNDGTVTDSDATVSMMEAAGIDTSSMVEVQSTMVDDGKNGVTEYSMGAIVVLAADDATGVGVVDDVLIPFLGIAALVGTLAETAPSFEFSKTARGNHSDDGLRDWSDTEIAQEISKLSGKLNKQQKALKRRLQKEQKVRGQRNKQKKGSEKGTGTGRQ